MSSLKTSVALKSSFDKIAVTWCKLNVRFCLALLDVYGNTTWIKECTSFRKLSLTSKKDRQRWKFFWHNWIPMLFTAFTISHDNTAAVQNSQGKNLYHKNMCTCSAICQRTLHWMYSFAEFLQQESKCFHWMLIYRGFSLYFHKEHAAVLIVYDMVVSPDQFLRFPEKLSCLNQTFWIFGAIFINEIFYIYK